MLTTNIAPVQMSCSPPIALRSAASIQKCAWTQSSPSNGPLFQVIFTTFETLLSTSLKTYKDQ